jgi:hypothetical protein
MGACTKSLGCTVPNRTSLRLRRYFERGATLKHIVKPIVDGLVAKLRVKTLAGVIETE